MQLLPPPAQPLKITPEQAAGFKTDSSKYYFVEFLDYQCPPCRANREKVNSQLLPYSDKIRFVVRNFPLRMHPNSTPAAIAAESAREQGQFWPMYDALLTGQALGASEIKSIVRKLNLDQHRFEISCQTTAREKVSRDLHDADAFGLDATPSFLLCEPSGRVWKLKNFKQIKDIVR